MYNFATFGNILYEHFVLIIQIMVLHIKKCRRLYNIHHLKNVKKQKTAKIRPLEMRELILTVKQFIGMIRLYNFAFHAKLRFANTSYFRPNMLSFNYQTRFQWQCGSRSLFLIFCLDKSSPWIASANKTIFAIVYVYHSALPPLLL